MNDNTSHCSSEDFRRAGNPQWQSMFETVKLSSDYSLLFSQKHENYHFWLKSVPEDKNFWSNIGAYIFSESNLFQRLWLVIGSFHKSTSSLIVPYMRATGRDYAASQLWIDEPQSAQKTTHTNMAGEIWSRQSLQHTYRQQTGSRWNLPTATNLNPTSTSRIDQVPYIEAIYHWGDDDEQGSKFVLLNSQNASRISRMRVENFTTGKNLRVHIFNSQFFKKANLIRKISHNTVLSLRDKIHQFVNLLCFT